MDEKKLENGNTKNENERYSFADIEKKKMTRESLRNKRSDIIFYEEAKRSKGFEVEKAIKDRYEELKNKALEQDIKLKKETLATLFWFLKVETFVIFCFTWFQATEWLGFHLEEWSFNLFVGATITQITAMLLIAVQHLFPKK